MPMKTKLAGPFNYSLDISHRMTVLIDMSYYQRDQESTNNYALKYLRRDKSRDRDRLLQEVMSVRGETAFGKLTNKKETLLYKETFLSLHRSSFPLSRSLLT
jgi:hypothetical protein